MNRRGFTLTELLMTLTITGVLGLALTRIMISDSRFVSRQDAMMAARQGARAAMHTTIAELRSISGGENFDPIVAVSRDSIRAKIPYAFGVFCRYTSSIMKAALLPTDSLAYANAVPQNRGVYWRDSTGAYMRLQSATVTVATSTATSACINGTDTVRVLPGGQLVQIGGLATLGTTPAQSFGKIFYLFQDITYFFGTSLDPSLPGRRALFRRLRAMNGSAISPADELVAPFDTSAKFRCLVGPNLAVEDCPASGNPADLSAELRGLELRMVAASDQKPQGSTTYQKFDLSTRIVFANRN